MVNKANENLGKQVKQILFFLHIPVFQPEDKTAPVILCNCSDIIYMAM